ncbi:MAG: 4Fe-4S ferredoxin [Candidatus Verstraetearchaeota archaeon]|nr:4Fe-4S ferredoxin [Candidatus Verstraetearchaeota archaeon]
MSWAIKLKAGAVDIYCLSGTGNTLLVARAMRDAFVQKGILAHVHPMERTDPCSINPKNALGLAFPVAILTTYPLVWGFIRSLPEVKGTEAFMVDTLGGLSMGIMAPMKRILESKGYAPIGAREIAMPVNFWNYEQEKKCVTIERGLERAREYTVDLIAGGTKWRSFPVLSDMAHLAFSNRFLWWLARQWPKMRVSLERCARCGLCVKLCPAGNIVMKDYPERQGGCQVCLRCYAYCPREAVLFMESFKRYRAVSAEDFLIA